MTITNPNPTVFQRLLCGALTVAALSSIAACGGKKQDEPQEQPPAVTTPAAATPDKPAAATPDKPAADKPAAAPAEISLESADLTDDVTDALNAGKLPAFGKTYPADKYCNDDTISNPGDIEVFTVSGTDKYRVYLCPGSLDGVDNVVTVFENGGAARTRTLSPASSTHRIEDEDLLNAVRAMLKPE